jgi:hypothetical protein
MVQAVDSVFPRGENQLVKQNLAERLREHILGVKSHPGSA